MSPAATTEDFDPTAYEAEAQQRWGHTDAYRESRQRTQRYGEAEWAQLGAEAAAINARLIALMHAGVPVSDPRVQAAVDDHRAHLTRWFYDCTPDLHRALGAMYVADPRFQRNIDKAAPGLAQYLSDAILAR